MPPYLDHAFIDEASRIVLKNKVGFITCINTIGNAMIINADTEKPAIKPKGGYGGLGGKAIKPVALANVHSFHRALKGKVSIMGVGGIETGRDLFEFILAGADACQVGTQLIKEGPQCFARMHNELRAWLQKNGHSSIQEAKGKLKE